VLIVSQVALTLQKGQQYAMKKVVKRKLSQVQRDLVLKEANTLAALSHENIVRLYRSNESDSESVMLLEWCDRPHYFEQKVRSESANNHSVCSDH
jgi:serine/threonine protein kinase